MAKLTGALLSLGARGQIANTVTFSKWKGRAYAKQYVVPSNPNTTAQQSTRNTFSFLNRVWPYFPAGSIAAWNLYADNNRFTARNGFQKQNLSVLRGDPDCTDIVLSVAAGGGIAPAAAVFTAASQAINVTVTAPTLPSGWTLDNVHALAMENVDPEGTATPDIGSASDNTDPYEPNVTGLLATTEYVVAAWCEFTKANGEKAYGSQISDVITTLA